MSKKKNEIHSYSSPTTPGLFVTFRNYVIELVCLNVDRRLGPKFWKDKKYWGPKYRREIKGIDNLRHKFGDFDNPLLQRVIVDVIKRSNIKSLSAKKTINSLAKKINDHRKNEIAKRKQYIKRTDNSNTKNADKINSVNYVDGGPTTGYAKVKAWEERGKKEK